MSDALVELSAGDPEAVRGTAAALDDRGEQLARTAGRARAVLANLFLENWRGDAAGRANARGARLALLLTAMAQRHGAAAAALRTYSASLEDAVALARRARQLEAQAIERQSAAQARDPSLAVLSAGAWSGPTTQGWATDPQAAVLSDAARRAEAEALELARVAGRRLADELARLCGREAGVRWPSPRILVDLAGMLPGYGEPIDAVNGMVYAAQKRWTDAGTSLAGAIPLIGWVPTGRRVLKAVGEVGTPVIRTTDTDDQVLDALRVVASPHQARHLNPRYLEIYRDRANLVESAITTAPAQERVIRFPDRGQLVRKYHHGQALFDLPVGAHPNRWQDFGEEIVRFVHAPTTVRIAGTFRERPAVIYADSVDMKRVVITELDGAFVSGYPLNRKQARRLWREHAIGIG